MKWVATVLVVSLFLFAGLVGYVRLQPHASSEWQAFAIGPAVGGSFTTRGAAIRADGISLLTLIARAYNVPPERVLGPKSLAMRFKLDAAVYDDNSEAFRPLLRRELESRFHLQTHKETRPCDVWVLTASRQPSLEPAEGRRSSLIDGRAKTVKIGASSMGDLAVTLQVLLGRAVVDETELAGRYDLAFGWSADRDRSIVTTLREQFGLFLSPGVRDVEVLVVDRIQPDPLLAMFSRIGSAIQYGPSPLRQGISRSLTIH